MAILTRDQRNDSAVPPQRALHLVLRDWLVSSLGQKSRRFADRSLLLVRRDEDVVGQLSLFLGLNLPADHQGKLVGTDRFQGRSPGTVGEDITVGYLEMRFKEFGLLPGNPDGTFIQKVPLVVEA